MTRRLEPRKIPVQKRSQVTVDSILSAAAQVFESHGYAAGTTNRIAERAGVSIGTLYQYFPNKETIAVALLEHHVSETARRLYEWVGHMVAERHTLRSALLDYVTDMLEMHSGRPRLQHILLEETPLPDRVHRTLLEAEHAQARSVAGLLETYPEVRGESSEKIGTIVVQTVESLTHRFAAHPEQQLMTREELLGEVADMLYAYIKARGGGRSAARAGK